MTLIQWTRAPYEPVRREENAFVVALAVTTSEIACTLITDLVKPWDLHEAALIAIQATDLNQVHLPPQPAR